MSETIAWPLADGHYAYCREPECNGCLPTEAALAQRHVLALWGEMLARCIAQTPQTKSHAGALAAIVADTPRYRKFSEEVRQKRTASNYWGPPPVPSPSEELK